MYKEEHCIHAYSVDRSVFFSACIYIFVRNVFMFLVPDVFLVFYSTLLRIGVWYSCCNLEKNSTKNPIQNTKSSPFVSYFRSILYFWNEGLD